MFITKKIRRRLTYLLLFLILFTSFPIAPSTVEAAVTTGSVKEYKTGAEFDDGKLINVTYNKKAATSTVYQTIAFLLRRDTVCSGTDALSSTCNPLEGGSSKYLRINLYNSNLTTVNSNWTIEELGECSYIKKYVSRYGTSSLSQIASVTGCKEPGMASASEAIVVSRYVIDETKMTDLLTSTPLFDDLRDGDKVYFNPVFRVKNSISGNSATKEFTNLTAIRNAEPWANKSLFRNKYDVPVEFKGAYPLVLKTLHEDTKSTLKANQKINNTARADGNWKAWQAGSKVEVPKTVKGTDGKTYQLQCTYITTMKKNQSLGCNSTGNAPNFTRDASITTRNPGVSVGGTYVVALYNANDDCKCSNVTTIPNKDTVGGEVLTNTLNKKVPIQVSMKQTDEEYQKWINWVNGKTDIKINVKMWRSDNTAEVPIDNKSTSPIWEVAGGSPKPDTAVSISADKLLRLINGKDVLTYNDNLVNYPIPADGKISFKYNTTITITAKMGNTTVTIVCKQGESAVITFTRPPDPVLNVGTYTSTPSYYSEIKEGSPETAGTSSNETFDAMSGTPTTRSLYFASGGSEFIVDIEVEYVPEVTQTRTYTSKFNEVVNGWAMTKITGEKQKDSAPPRPTPRKATDDSGATYTEKVTLKDEKVVDKEAVPCTTQPNGLCTGGKPEESHKEYWWVQEGYENTKVGGYSDTWTQEVTFDYMKINKVVVWKLDKSKVNGMATLTGTSEITATVKQGDPTVFSNIAKTNTSKDGRLRYSLETDQHDTVEWKEGDSDNTVKNNSKDSGKVHEQKKFNERRALTTNVTAISDFLILQTSTGDQAVMYFEKKSQTKKVTEKLAVPTSDFETMWTKNSNSAAKWDTKTKVSTGSYNGKYSSPSSKYSGSNGSTVSSVLDSLPAGITRPSKSSYMRLVEENINVKKTLSNGEYLTGQASVFYKLVLNHNPSNKRTVYSTTTNTKYKDRGQEFVSTYSLSHSKVNDVVIHNPVSVQNAMVVSLPSRLDQRTTESRALGGNLFEGVAEFERVLDPNYRQNLVVNGDAEYANVDMSVAGWKTYKLTGTGNNINFTSRSGDVYVIDGTRSFEVMTLSSSKSTGGYYLDVPVKANTKYKFNADVACHRCSGGAVLDLYDVSGKMMAGSGIGKTSYTSSYTPINQEFEFTTGANVSYVRIHLYKGVDRPASDSLYAHLFADNVSLVNMTTQEFIAIDPVYVTQVIANPDYGASTPGETVEFGMTGAAEYYTVPKTGSYTIEAWGASGGANGSVSGGKGGYSKGTVNLNQGDKLQVEVGQAGTSNGRSTFGGGGAANDSSGASGGGASTIGIVESSSAGNTYIDTNISGEKIAGLSNGIYSYISFDPSIYSIFELKVKNNSNHSSARIYFSDFNVYTDANSVAFELTTKDEEYKTYRVDMSSNPNWVKIAKSLGFHLAYGHPASTIDIEYIRLYPGATMSELTVAGGGGGASHNNKGTGGAGGGLSGGNGGYTGGILPVGGTQTAGYMRRIGEPARSHTGGGGGGYWGGKTGSSYNSTSDHSGGGGGSGYLSSALSGAESTVGVWTGNGKVVITSNSALSNQPETVEIKTLVGGSSTEPPSDAYILKPVTVNPNAPSGGYTPGNFIVLDNAFQVYFPNTGDFEGNNAWGLATTTSTRGKGFTNNMDTTEWTKSKAVRFAFNVIYNDTMYEANKWIDLPADKTLFNFYLPLANREAISATVEWKSLAINSSGEDNETPTNKVRYSLGSKNHAAKHSTVKRYSVDIVGRIGNMVIEDTGDFRFSNLFKQAVTPTQWLVKNVVKKVNTTKQNKIVGDLTDIRGNTVNASTKYLNTYGLMSHMEQSPIAFPLSPEKNNIVSLRNQPLRIGYDVLTDIQTIGNYYSNMQITPYYYSLNLKNGAITPVDIYMSVGGSYKIINDHGATKEPNWNPNTVYSNPVVLDWNSEALRRNATSTERNLTSSIAGLFAESGGDTSVGKASEPFGTYLYGTSQIMQLTGRNRTFIGNDETYSQNKNPGNKFSKLEFAMQSQRWHHSYKLPSSAVAVKAGEKPTQTNIDAMSKNTSVIIMAADILAIGDTFTLQYKAPNHNVRVAGTNWPTTDIPYPVITVYSPNKSSADDLTTSGTH